MIHHFTYWRCSQRIAIRLIFVAIASNAISTVCTMHMVAITAFSFGHYHGTVMSSFQVLWPVSYFPFKMQTPPTFSFPTELFKNPQHPIDRNIIQVITTSFVCTWRMASLTAPPPPISRFTENMCSFHFLLLLVAFKMDMCTFRNFQKNDLAFRKRSFASEKFNTLA